MAGLFSKPKMPAPQEPIQTPVVDQSQINRNQSDLAKRRRGRASTDLTSGSSSPQGTSGAVASSQLLGA